MLITYMFLCGNLLLRISVVCCFIKTTDFDILHFTRIHCYNTIMAVSAKSKEKRV